MATFEKETVVSENLCGNISVYLFKKLFLTYFFERTILLLIGGSFQYIFQIVQTGHSKRFFDQWIDHCISKEAGCELLCIVENFYASGTQDAGVTK